MAAARSVSMWRTGRPRALPAIWWTPAASPSVVKYGAGTQSLSGDNTVGGVFSVVNGTLSLDSATAMSSNASLVVATGAQATVNGVDLTIGELVTTGSGDGTVNLSGGSLTVAQAGAVNAFAGTITGTGSFIVNGSGGLIQTLSGTSDYSGATKVEQGTLQAGAADSFSAASAHTVSSGATLDLNDFDETIGSLAGAGDVTLGAGKLTTGGDNSSITTFSGVASGSGGLIKAGSGTMILSGTNLYTGGTTVTGGTLSISSDANLGNGGTVALENGTTLAFTAGGTYSHSITVAGDPTFDVGTGLTVTQNGVIADGATPGEVEKTGAGTLVLGAANTYTGGTTVTAGTLQLGIGRQPGLDRRADGERRHLRSQRPHPDRGKLLGYRRHRRSRHRRADGDRGDRGQL